MSRAARGILLVEDDEGDAVLVRECLREAGVLADDVVWQRNLTDAVSALDDTIACVLLDLGLPDSHGLGGLQQLSDAADEVPVIVLTGRHGSLGTDALAAGAQDYLVKDDITPELLLRTIRYAVQRQETQATEIQLREERLLLAENARLERGLLPRPLLRSEFVSCASHYRPGRARAVLGGDFFDVVETPDGRIRAVIGDVMGHGPDEAAIGIHLRVAWRALVLGGVPDEDIFGALARLLEAEQTGGRFVTLCDVTLDGDRVLSVRAAGHPPPLLGVGGVGRYADVTVAPPLGVPDPRDHAASDTTRVQLDDGASIMLYTDGLLDSYRRLDDLASIGEDELLVEAQSGLREGQRGRGLITRVVGNAPGPAADDTAVVVLTLGGER